MKSGEQPGASKPEFWGMAPYALSL